MGIISRLFRKNNAVEFDGDKVELESTNISCDVFSEVDENVPQEQGDYAKTIFLWIHDNASPARKDDEYSLYVKNECGIVEPSRYHSSLVQEGYFVPASSYAKLNTLKVVQIKKLLSDFAMPVSGKKDVLINRLMTTLTSDDMLNLFPSEIYELSEKGRTFLDEHYDYVLLHKHKTWNIDWVEYDKFRESGHSFYDTVWEILNKRALNDRFLFGRSQYFHMYELLQEEGKNEQALQMLLKVLYLDLSGVCGMHYFRAYRDGMFDKDYLRSIFPSVITLAPGIVDRISKYKDLYNDAMVEELFELSLPVRVCNKQNFLSLVYSIICGSFDMDMAEKMLRDEYNKYIARM